MPIPPRVIAKIARKAGSATADKVAAKAGSPMAKAKASKRSAAAEAARGKRPAKRRPDGRFG